MSGSVIRFALVVTSLLSKLAISSWPPPPPLVSDRFPSVRFAITAKAVCLRTESDRPTTGHVSIGPSEREKKEKGGRPGAQRGATWKWMSRPYSDKLYRRFVTGRCATYSIRLCPPIGITRSARCN
ncbi:hypothetical protein PUN28_018554 [Cardiocondyla obscurior]|uniref:Secreted protein n=1 Tax=Cardiocondyla obscurior TaxID=286306 RepID=A0AAW2EEE0_9HYME